MVYMVIYLMDVVNGKFVILRYDKNSAQTTQNTARKSSKSLQYS
jgi:hypothetical protein